MAELSNLRATARRHSTPGSLVILLCAVLVFGPRLWDAIRGEPWIDNHLTVVQNSGGGVVVEDVTVTNAPVNGLRFTSAETADGTVLCSTEQTDIWLGETKRFWRLPAFTGCEQPQEPYRVCSRFSIRSAVIRPLDDGV